MTYALWVVAAWAGSVQDPEWTVGARARKTAEGFELLVRGSGAVLRGAESAEVRIRRQVHRYDEEAGVLRTEPAEEARGGAVCAQDGAFSYREAFEAPMEVEVEAVVRTPDGGVVRRASVRAWTAPAYAVAAALEADARRAEAALGGVEGLLDELEALEPAGPPRAASARRLRAKIERRRAEWTPEVSRSLLSATAALVDGLFEDLHTAAESASVGRSVGGFLARTGGSPFSIEEARRRIERIRAVGVGERMLVLVRATAALREEIRAGAATGCPFRWSRIEEDVERSLEAAAQADPEGHLEALLAAVRDFLAEAGGQACPESGDPGAAERRLVERAEELERRYRAVGP
jgi:hypothetical protein